MKEELNIGVENEGARLCVPAAVLFDLDDTLYDSTRLSTEARGAAVEAMVEAGLPVRRDEALAALLRIVREVGSNDSRHFDRLLAALGQRRDPRLIAAGIVAYHNAKQSFLRPFVDTVPTLLALRDRGCRLGVVSNGLAVKQWEKLIRLGLQHVFHGVVVSEDVGEEKPAPALFAAACDKLGYKPAQCWFVGNHPDCDVAGAVAFGMSAVFIRHGRYADAQLPPSLGPVAEIATLAELLPLYNQARTAPE